MIIANTADIRPVRLSVVWFSAVKATVVVFICSLLTVTPDSFNYVSTRQVSWLAHHHVASTFPTNWGEWYIRNPLFAYSRGGGLGFSCLKLNPIPSSFIDKTDEHQALYVYNLSNESHKRQLDACT